MEAITLPSQSNDARVPWRNFKNRTMTFVLFGCSVAAIAPLIFVLYFLIKKGFSSLDWSFFTQLPKPTGEVGGGMANAIAGTLELLAMASALGVPLGLLGGVYISEYGSNRANYWIRLSADLLNGVPSIVWGMVVYAMLVVPFKTFSVYAGSTALGIMMIPLVMRTTEEVLTLVPQSYRESGLALGIAPWKVTVVIVMRAAMKGITTGVLIAIARVAGETAPLLFTALGNNFWSHSLKEPIAALPLQIFSYAISPYEDLHRQAWAGALVLILIIFGLNIFVRVLSSDRKFR